MRLSFLAVTLALLTSPLATNQAADPKPNILVIVSDDHGYGDTGFQGCKDIPTPHLDGLAREGLRCTNGYVSHPFCSPTRAGLMTGRYQARFGHEHNPFYNPADHSEGLPLSEHILPEFLKKAGYTTGWIGKWHLGATPELRPINRGFQETIGFIGGGHRYQNWQPNVKNEYLVPIERNGKPVDVKEHLTVAFGHEAADFVRRHKDLPWFLYLAFNAPHTPNEPTPERLARFASIEDKKRRAYAAQVSLMDDAIGAALTALRQTGQDRRTLVFFFSDNGGPIGQRGNGSQNGPLRDGKGSVYEGGVRVPFVVSWPGTLPSGKDFAAPVCSLDVFATAMASAGQPMPTDRPYDSVNILPYLKGEKAGEPHESLFWRTDGKLQAAVRQGSTKLVRDGSEPDQLFHLGDDIGEKKNIAAADSKTTAGMNDALDAWFGQMAKRAAFKGAGGPEREWPKRPK